MKQGTKPKPAKPAKGTKGKTREGGTKTVKGGKSVGGGGNPSTPNPKPQTLNPTGKRAREETAPPLRTTIGPQA